MPLIEIDGIKVAYEDAGAGLPIVFIPSLVGTKEWFKNQIAGLRERYRIISYDLRTAADHRDYNLDLLANDLAHFLSALRLDSAVIAGDCFGAMVAMRSAFIHRQQIDGLILISAFPSLPEASKESILDWMAPAQVSTETSFLAAVKKMLHVGTPAHAENVEGRVWLEKHSATLSRSILDRRIDIIQQFDATDWLEDIEAPSLIITGAHDEEPFLRGAQVLYEKIPASQLEIIEEGDHYVFYTRHDIVNTLIDEFIIDHLMSL